LACASLGFWGVTAHAQIPSYSREPPPRVIEDRFRFELLLQGSQIDSTLRLDPAETQRGTPLDLENDLDLDDLKTQLQFELTALPGEHNLIRLSSMSTRRSATATVDQIFMFDDQIFLVNDVVDSEVNLILYGLTYGYRFFPTNRIEITPTFGIQIAEVEARIRSRSRTVSEDEDGVAPIPLLGLEGSFAINDRWAIDARAQYLGVRISGVVGSIKDVRLGGSYQFNPHVAVGLGYRLFDIDVENEDGDNPGRVEYRLDGPMLYVRGSL
jgi:hypothetical protein